jgi:hypothetical protein
VRYVRKEKKRTSAAAAARALASSAAVEPDPGVLLLLLPPSVRGGPPTFLGALAAAGTEAEVGAGGVLPRGRPGCEKGSRSLLQRLPMFLFCVCLSIGEWAGVVVVGGLMVL